MMIICTSCIVLRRRHFERRSKTESAGVSSMKIGDSDSRPVIDTSFATRFVQGTFRSLSDGIPVSEEIIRWTNWMDDISQREDGDRFVELDGRVACKGQDESRLTMAGRAARMIRSISPAGCQSVQIGKAASTPVIPYRALLAASIRRVASLTMALISPGTGRMLPWAMSNRFFRTIQQVEYVRGIS